MLQFLPTLSDGEKAQLQSELQALEDDLGGWEGVARIHERGAYRSILPGFVDCC